MRTKTGISYFGNRNPRHFLVDLEEIISHNCNFIVHTFSENDQLFYQATMREMVELSKKADLEVYLEPWGVGRVFGGEAFSSFALKNLDTCQQMFSGKTAPASCLNNPRFVDFMMGWIDDAVQIGANVLLWNEPHFYNVWSENDEAQDWSCCCESCRKKYAIFYGERFPETVNDDLFKFREDSMVDFLATLCSYGKSKGARNAVCLLPINEKAAGVSDWSKIARLPELDILATDPYWVFLNRDLRFFGDYVSRLMNLSKRFGVEPQIWIQNFKIPTGREPEILEAIAIAYAEGIRNFAASSFSGSEYMSYIKCDNPTHVWDLLGEVYGKIRKGEWD